MKSFYEGKRAFNAEPQGSRIESMNAYSRRNGRMAFLFFVAMVLLAVCYGGTVLGLYALWAMSCLTLWTAFVGLDTAELFFAGSALRSVRGLGELKQE